MKQLTTLRKQREFKATFLHTMIKLQISQSFVHLAQRLRRLNEVACGQIGGLVTEGHDQ